MRLINIAKTIWMLFRYAEDATAYAEAILWMSYQWERGMHYWQLLIFS